MGSLCSCFARVLLIPYNSLLRSPNIHLDETNRLLIFYRPREGNKRKKKNFGARYYETNKKLTLGKDREILKRWKNVVLSHISVLLFFVFFVAWMTSN